MHWELRCVSHLSSIVLWFEFDLISQLILGFSTYFVLQTLISIIEISFGFVSSLSYDGVGKSFPPIYICCGSQGRSCVGTICMLPYGSLWHSQAVTLVSFLFDPLILWTFISPRSLFSMLSLPPCSSHWQYRPPPWLSSSPLLNQVCSVAGVCRHRPFLPPPLHPHAHFSSAIFCWTSLVQILIWPDLVQFCVQPG